MRVCIIGNSHIAALKSGWDLAGRDFRGSAELMFFGSHGTSLTQVRQSQRRLVTGDPLVRRSLVMTTGMANPELPIDDFDCFLLHALVNPNWIAPYTRQLSRHCAKHDSEVSSGLVKAVASEVVERAVMRHMLDLLRAVTTAPIFVSPQPYVSELIQERPSQNRDYSGFSKPDQYRDLPFAEAFRSVLSAASVDHRFTWLRQPEESIVGGYFTAHRFCSGSVRLSEQMNEEHPDDDFAHMNPAYGTLVLRDLFQAAGLREPVPGAPPQRGEDTPVTAAVR